MRDACGYTVERHGYRRALDGTLYTNAENYAAGNITGEQYAMRDFVRDDLERKYRKEYDDALAELDNNDEDDD